MTRHTSTEPVETLDTRAGEILCDAGTAAWLGWRPDAVVVVETVWQGRPVLTPQRVRLVPDRRGYTREG